MRNFRFFFLILTLKLVQGKLVSVCVLEQGIIQLVNYGAVEVAELFYAVQFFFLVLLVIWRERELLLWLCQRKALTELVHVLRIFWLALY